jgi:hypothetical protein
MQVKNTVALGELILQYNAVLMNGRAVTEQLQC